MSKTEPREKIQERFDQLIGMQTVFTDAGQVELHLPVTPMLLNAGQLLHGGVIASLLDQAIGMSIRTKTEKRLVTVNLSVSFLASAKLGDLVIAKATTRHLGKHLATGEGEVCDSEGKLLAIATGTFKLLETKGEEETG